MEKERELDAPIQTNPHPDAAPHKAHLHDHKRNLERAASPSFLAALASGRMPGGAVIAVA